MKANGDFELSDVPALIERGSPKDLLGARAALVDAAQRIVSGAESDCRAMKPLEQIDFDEHMAQIRDINGALARYKAQRIADCAGTGLAPVLPF